MGVARKKTEYSYNNNAAQYNKGERLYVSLQTWIYVLLKTGNWAW